VAAITACPNCQRQLKVPENLLGRTVRCPSCKTTFVAQAGEEEAAIAMIDEEPRAPEPGRPVSGAHVAPRRRVRASEEAASALKGPAICLLIFGVIAIILGFLGGAFYALVLPNLAQAQANNPQFGGGQQPPPAAFLIGSGVVNIVLASFWGGLVIAGSICMLRLRVYPLAMTGAIVAMLPCTGCCLVGLPLGIWALVVLQRPEVKNAFT
jgi:predicted Zn finger-like uncharacterized protein